MLSFVDVATYGCATSHIRRTYAEKLKRRTSVAHPSHVCRNTTPTTTILLNSRLQVDYLFLERRYQPTTCFVPGSSPPSSSTHLHPPLFILPSSPIHLPPLLSIHSPPSTHLHPTTNLHPLFFFPSYSPPTPSGATFFLLSWGFLPHPPPSGVGFQTPPPPRC